MYDYEAPAPEYLSFNNADVIAVTGTAVSPSFAYRVARLTDVTAQPDGWWQGERVGILTRGGTTFPSKFVPFSLPFEISR